MAAIGTLGVGTAGGGRRADGELLVEPEAPRSLLEESPEPFEHGEQAPEEQAPPTSARQLETERQLREVEQGYIQATLPKALEELEVARKQVQRAIESPAIWGHERGPWEETYRARQAEVDFLLEGQRRLASRAVADVGCAQTVRLFDGGLSPDWAQQVSGLIDAEQHLAARVGLRPIRVGVIDTSEHGAKAARLAVGGWPVPNPVPQSLELFLNTHASAWTVSHATEAANALRQRPVEERPQLFNFSFGMSAEFKAALAPLIEDGALAVTSAGNGHDRPISAEKAALDLVIVSSSSPFGPFRSMFAQVGPEVTVFAPSESHVHSVFLGQPAPFGGTSGASPLGARAVGLALSTLGELTPGEARTLLRRTSTGHVDWPGRPEGASQPGVLNAYRLVRVAERLSDLGWPARREELLARDDLYDFAAEGAALEARAGQLLEEGEPDRALPLLRQAFLLTESPAARQALAALFEAQGNWVDALYYRAFDLSLQDVALELAQRGADHSTREFIEAAVKASPKDRASIERWLADAAHLPAICVAQLVSDLWQLGKEGEEAVARYHATCSPVRLAMVSFHTGLHNHLADLERRAAA